MEKERRLKWPTIKITHSFWVAVLDVLFLLPAAIFWSSVTLYTSLGTDYVFDVVIAQLNQSVWGNGLIIFLVIGCPAITIAVSGMEYIKTRKGGYKWGIGLGGLFLLLGFYAAFKKY